MLYDYKFTLAQMGQIQNYKKKNSFHHTLLNIEDLELPTFEILCNVAYKKTIPLNIFEKYSIRLIDKAYEVYSKMNIEKISQLLYLDKNLIRENLENLEAIGMLNNIDSDNITINRAKNAEYLRYENKFRIEISERNYNLTKTEYDDKDNFIEKEFIKKNRDKKYQSSSILNEKKSTINVNLLNFGDNNFLIFSKSKINSESDLKFIDEDMLSKSSSVKLPKNIFCHYDEFLPILRDIINSKSDDIIIIGSNSIEKSYLTILPSKKENNIYILSSDTIEHKRIFNINCNDFTWIGSELYKRVDRFIIEIQDDNYKQEIKQKLENYFTNMILEIEPNYNLQKNKDIENQINSLTKRFNKFKFKTKKEIDIEIKRINTEKNRLYGLTSKNAQTRSKARQKIDKFEEENNQKELEKYLKYLQNRDKILEFKDCIKIIEKEKKEIIDLNDKIAQLNSKKSKPLSKNNKEKIIRLEKELSNLKRLKI